MDKQPHTRMGQRVKSARISRRYPGFVGDCRTRLNGFQISGVERLVEDGRVVLGTVGADSSVDAGHAPVDCGCMARIWIPLPDRDFDVTEVAVPWKVLSRAGHSVVFSTETGTLTPEADPLLLTGVLFG